MPAGPIAGLSPTAGIYHTVARGETLFHIAKSYGVDLQELKRLNHMSSNRLATGQQLFIPQLAIVPFIFKPFEKGDLTQVRQIVGPKHYGSRWVYITVHHSATFEGSGGLFNRDHKRRGMGGLFYHFVIGNGSYSRDGSIEVGWRWKRQVSSKRNRPHDIQICLVGNFDIQQVSDAQFNSLVALITVLQEEYGITLSHVRGHHDIPGKHTDCPGTHFPFARLKQSLAANNFNR